MKEASSLALKGSFVRDLITFLLRPHLLRHNLCSTNHPPRIPHRHNIQLIPSLLPSSSLAQLKVSAGLPSKKAY